MNKTRILVIDEQPFFRSGVRLALSSQLDFELFECNPGNETLNCIETIMPDVVLLGSDLTNHKGLEMGTLIARRYPNTKVIILSPDPDDQELFEAIRSSAVACLNKSVEAKDLIGNIRRVSRGEYPINDNVMTRPLIARQVLRSFQEMEPISKKIEAVVVPLTNREHEILIHVAEGNTNKQIAKLLAISEQTIKNHVSAIMRKLNANDRAHAVVLAIRHGMISIEETV